jgi:DNA-directed RNA polymerase subunit RPC12/RpoP
LSRAPEIAFACPGCGREAVAGLDGSGRCPSCGAETALELPASVREERVLERCPACGSKQLYVQRDFNQKAGIAIVAAGAVLAPFTPYYSSLIAAALVDAALYAVLPEITVCYRCHAHFRGFARNPRHTAFDLHTAEQYDVKTPPRA